MRARKRKERKRATRPQGLGKRDQEILGATMTENLPKLRSDTKPSIRETEKAKQDKNYSCGKRKSTARRPVYILQKIKDEERSLERSWMRKAPYL